MPEHLLAQLTTSDLVALGIGAVLLLAGRKLFWLALGGIGFLFGLAVSAEVLNLSSPILELGLALFCGLSCAFLAVFAQKIAVALAGLVLGGLGALWLASLFEPGAFAGEPSPWLLAVAVVGGVLGVFVAPSLFEASLAAFTSLVGAFLIVSRAHVGSPHESWIFVGLALVGFLVQSIGGRERTAERDERRARA